VVSAMWKKYPVPLIDYISLYEVTRIDRVQKRADLFSAEGRRLTFRSGEFGRLGAVAPL
jgi:hypothetical protein